MTIYDFRVNDTRLKAVRSPRLSRSHVHVSNFRKAFTNVCVVLIFGPKLASSSPSFPFCSFFIHLLCYSPRSLAEKALKGIHRGKNIFFPSTWNDQGLYQIFFPPMPFDIPRRVWKKERKERNGALRKTESYENGRIIPRVYTG